MLSHLDRHIIIVGFGAVGQLLSDKIKSAGTGVLVIERDAETAAAASSQGHLVIEGEANVETTLRRAQIERARAILLTVDDTTQRLTVTLMARALNPDIYILTIGRSEPGRDWLMHAGASDVLLVDRVIADTLHDQLLQKIKLA